MNVEIVRLPIGDPPEVRLLGFAIFLKQRWLGDVPIQLEIPSSVLVSLERTPTVFKEVFSDLLLDYGPEAENLVTIYAVSGEEFGIRTF